MGFGETYWHDKVSSWWRSLSSDIQARVRIKYPANEEWAGVWEECV
jgi:hypothetical protein